MSGVSSIKDLESLVTPITCWFCSEPFHFLGLVQARYEWAHPKNTAGTQQCFIEGHVIRFDTEFLPRFSQMVNLIHISFGVTTPLVDRRKSCT